MIRPTLGRVGIAAAALALPLGLAAVPAQAADMATVSVLHAIPEGSGADVVDGFANGDLLIDNFTPGTLETVEVPAGTYDLGLAIVDSTAGNRPALRLAVQDMPVRDGWLIAGSIIIAP